MPELLQMATATWRSVIRHSSMNIGKEKWMSCLFTAKRFRKLKFRNCLTYSFSKQYAVIKYAVISGTYCLLQYCLLPTKFTAYFQSASKSSTIEFMQKRLYVGGGPSLNK